MKTKCLVLIAICSAIIVVCKEALAFLPNVELVTFLLMMFALSFPLSDAVMISIIFSFVETILYGVGMWTPMYFVIWPLIVIVTYYVKPNNYQKAGLLSGVFGLLFGLGFSIPYFLISIKTGWIYFVNGIYFDLIHAVCNYLIMIILYDRLSKVIRDLMRKWITN